MRLKLIASVLAAHLMIASCSKHPSSDEVVTGPSEAGLVSKLLVDEVRIGPSSQSTTDTRSDPISVYDEIRVSIRPNGASRGGEVAAKVVSLANGHNAGLQKADVKPSQKESIIFVFTSDKPWASGRYLLEVTVDGELAEHRHVDISERASTSATPRR